MAPSRAGSTEVERNDQARQIHRLDRERWVLAELPGQFLTSWNRRHYSSSVLIDVRGNDVSFCVRAEPSAYGADQTASLLQQC
jgi:hypothetical protein